MDGVTFHYTTSWRVRDMQLEQRLTIHDAALRERTRPDLRSAGWTFFTSPPGSATALIPPGSRRFPTLGDVEKAVISMFKEGSQQVIPGLDPVETPHA